jgi:hypothetical protein
MNRRRNKGENIKEKRRKEKKNIGSKRVLLMQNREEFRQKNTIGVKK